MDSLRQPKLQARNGGGQQPLMKDPMGLTLGVQMATQTLQDSTRHDFWPFGSFPGHSEAFLAIDCDSRQVTRTRIFSKGFGVQVRQVGLEPCNEPARGFGVAF